MNNEQLKIPKTCKATYLKLNTPGHNGVTAAKT